MSEELKRCPFCASKAEYFEIDEGEGFASCTNPNCYMHGYDRLIDAKEWNTRPLEDTLQQKLDEDLNARIEEERIENMTRKTDLYFDSEVE